MQYTTPLISGLTFKKDSTRTASYTYTYDALGNILTVSENGVLKLSYQYDELNQLTRENNAYANKTWTYSYDNAGNILEKREYTYSAGTLSGTYQAVNYAYTATGWGDLLTSYGGTTVSYDTIGNPLNWRNLSAITWEGRKAVSFTANSGATIQATYNADGIRTSKTFTLDTEIVVHSYVLDGTKIIKESVTGTQNYTLYPYYDASGSVVGIEYNGTSYYFQKNLQGDIIRICDTTGNTVVQYTYDAWG